MQVLQKICKIAGIAEIKSAYAGIAENLQIYAGIAENLKKTCNYCRFSVLYQLMLQSCIKKTAQSLVNTLALFS